MSWKPKLNPVTVPPRALTRPEDWIDFIKRYMTDHTSFRTVLRDWTVAVDDDLAAIAATAIGGGVFDYGLVTESATTTVDFGDLT